MSEVDRLGGLETLCSNLGTSDSAESRNQVTKVCRLGGGVVNATLTKLVWPESFAACLKFKLHGMVHGLIIEEKLGR